ncbi:MAG: hypothetical protein QUS33_00760 [Dehalococcoidia bacterium]|nr:hypothetical protein [Dehalococcoidia bacterium]
MESEERRAADAFSVFLFGLGILLLILGPCAGFYEIATGLIALVACWVIAVTIRVFYFHGTRDERRSRYY